MKLEQREVCVGGRGGEGIYFVAGFEQICQEVL